MATRTVTLNGVRVQVQVNEDARDDATAAHFGSAQATERRMGIRLDSKRGRNNANSHPGWRIIDDRRAAYVLALSGYGTHVLAETKSHTRASYGNPARDLRKHGRKSRLSA